MASDFPVERSTDPPVIRHPDAQQTLELSRWVQCPNAAIIIEIDQLGDKYCVTVRDGRGWRDRCKCKFTAHDLSTIYKSLCNEAEQTLLSQGRMDKLYSLADVGYLIYCNIFSKERIRAKIRELLSVKCGPDPLYLVVHSECCAIPWSLLYMEKPGAGKLDRSLFFGDHCIVVSDITDPEEVPNQPHPEIPPRIEILGAHCHKLKYSHTREIPFIRRVAKRLGSCAHFSDFPELSTTRAGAPAAESDQTARRHLFGSNSSIVHFACHGSNDKSPDKNYFRVRNMYRLTYAALHNPTERFTRSPLVFLNACEMGFNDPLRFTTMVRFFLEHGARAVIAPDCKVSDKSAARFSQSFYAYLLRGDPLMYALFRARHEMLDKYNDFIGFAYSLYGQAHAHLTKEQHS